MKQPRRSFNPKRCIETNIDEIELATLAERISYGGNPEHKSSPGDFGLTPPSQARPDKTLCDGVGIFKREVAESLLRKGARKGFISVQRRNGFPQNVWSVTESNEPLEAQLENERTGSYHGYPMSTSDPMRHEVLERWSGL